jgi:hypothetical protein
VRWWRYCRCSHPMGHHRHYRQGTDCPVPWCSCAKARRAWLGLASARNPVAVQYRLGGPWRSLATGHRITRDGGGGVPWQTRSRPWTVPLELAGRWRACGVPWGRPDLD